MLSQSAGFVTEPVTELVTELVTEPGPSLFSQAASAANHFKEIPTMPRTLLPLRLLTLSVLLALLVPVTLLAASPVNKSLFGGVAIDGYDPVAYFTDSKPVAGKKEFEHTYQGATWRFASAEHRDLFAADPEKYAPQYGGYRAYAVAQGKLAGIDPEAWTIVEGKLYLNYSKKIRAQWEKDIPGFITKGDENWPGLVDEQ